MTDLNYLFLRQQSERARASEAACENARIAHAQLAALYEEAIETATEGRVRFALPRAEITH